MSEIPRRQWWILLLAITVVHLIGMIYIDIMEVDAAQYASISQEMMQSGEYLQVQHRHKDYLDKPPLLFWVTSASFELFGPSNFTFRLPSFLFLLLGLFSTFKLGEKLYDRRTGQLSVLILYSTQAYFLFGHDVRTDTILANAVIFAIWQLWLFIEYKKAKHMILGAIGVALAMLEKGPIGLMVPVLALGSQVLYARKLKIILRWEWLLGLLVIAVMLTPMVYGLHEQYGMKGVEFYFWTQSFGRLTGENEWSDNTTSLYFVHTFLWAFLPWMILAYFGVIKNLVQLVKNKFSSTSGMEIITLAGFVLTFIAMSLSHYKLPHYIFVVFPLAALITADTIWKLLDGKKMVRVFLGIQIFINLLLIIASLLLLFIAFWATPIYVFLPILLLYSYAVYVVFTDGNYFTKIVTSTLLVIIGVNLGLNAHVYPTLLTYQAGSTAGKFLKELNPSEPVYCFNVNSHGLDYYSGKIAPRVEMDFIESNDDFILYTNQEGFQQVKGADLEFELLKELKHYHVTALRMEFLVPDTRANTLQNIYVLRVK